MEALGEVHTPPQDRTLDGKFREDVGNPVGRIYEQTYDDFIGLSIEMSVPSRSGAKGGLGLLRPGKHLVPGADEDIGGQAGHEAAMAWKVAVVMSIIEEMADGFGAAAVVTSGICQIKVSQRKCSPDCTCVPVSQFLVESC
jgi:hypothetical protein